MIDHTMQRREFITLLGGAAAAWPVAAAAQQAVPVIGFLSIFTETAGAPILAGFRKGLSEMGYVEGRNVAVEFRWAAMQYNRLPELAADLVRRRVAVIATPSGIAAATAAIAATTSIPVVFSTGADPVQSGLVQSLNRPGGNVTGINFMSLDLAGKRLGLLHELLPSATRFAGLFDFNTLNVPEMIADAQTAAATIGRPFEVLRAGSSSEIDAAFARLAQMRVDGLLVAAQPLFTERRVQIATLAVRHSMPMMSSNRQITEVGGLMSYGTSTGDQARQVGLYVGRILKGEKPADLPVMRSTKFDLVINLQTAKTIGLTIPPTLLALADGVIE